MIRGDDSGSGRQLAAILAENDRTAGLRTFDRPALVIHGDHDRIIKPSGGRATAAALPDGELLVLAGMGHDLARRLRPDVLEGIERTVRRGEGVHGTGPTSRPHESLTERLATAVIGVGLAYSPRGLWPQARHPLIVPHREGSI